MSNWLSLPVETQKELFNQISAKTGLPPFAVEKDAWVTLALRMLFTSILKEHIVFKGGTSLSKCYNLINRLSEDIDIAIDRKFLGFSGDLTSGQIRKLRRSVHNFVKNDLPDILNYEFERYGIDNKEYQIQVPNDKISDQDPEILFIKYKTVFDETTYLQSNVKIELGGRSLLEPFEVKKIGSLVDKEYQDSNFDEENFIVNVVLPEKTLIEKMFLLPEEFQKTKEKMKEQRMSRHLYDIFQIMETKYFTNAIKNEKLFRAICLHREKFTPLKPIGTVDYDNLTIGDLQLVPPKNIIGDYMKDYREMQTTMFYGESPSFETILQKLEKIQSKENS